MEFSCGYNVQWAKTYFLSADVTLALVKCVSGATNTLGLGVVFHPACVWGPNLISRIKIN